MIVFGSTDLKIVPEKHKVLAVLELGLCNIGKFLPWSKYAQGCCFLQITASKGTACLKLPMDLFDIRIVTFSLCKFSRLVRPKWFWTQDISRPKTQDAARRCRFLGYGFCSNSACAREWHARGSLAVGDDQGQEQERCRRMTKCDPC